MKDFSLLEKKLRIKFKNQNFLIQALVHRSYLNENPNFFLPHNERLEFFGDAVLELVVTEYLYENYPNPEGELTSFRASLVNTRSLSELAQKFDLDKFVLLSRGEKRGSKKAREVILANAFEALIGAIYFDQGLKKVKTFLKEHLLSKLSFILEKKLYRDPKSQFQELAQEKYRITPSYQVLSEIGPAHQRYFIIGVYLNEKKIAQGEGWTKQEAQIKAAEEALKKIRESKD